ncbi:9287_t:CDS:2, partial [Scutellospora calospora]
SNKAKSKEYKDSNPIDIYHRFLYPHSDFIAEMLNKLKKEINQSRFQHHIDPVESALKLLDKYNQGINVTEIYIDAIYRTARGHYELYGIIVNIESTGFPIAYLVLKTKKAKNTCTSTGKHEFLKSFLIAIKECSIEPNFVFTNKDFVKINMITNV